MEEKTNRIAEVIISSVSPFQLMMGKIIGIGAVGLTQFLIWIVLIGILTTVASSLIPPEVLQQVQQSQEGMPGTSQQGSEAFKTLASAQLTFPVLTGVWLCFVSYFIF